MISAKRSGDTIQSVHDLKAAAMAASLCQFATWLLPDRGGVAIWLDHHSVLVRSNGIGHPGCSCTSTAGESLSNVAIQ